MSDAGLEQAVRDAATAAGVRPDRVQLISRLLPPAVLTRTVDNRIDTHAVEVGVRGVLHLIPEWLEAPSATPSPAGAGSSGVSDLIRLMNESVGISAPGGAR